MNLNGSEKGSSISLSYLMVIPLLNSPFSSYFVIPSSYTLLEAAKVRAKL